MPLPARTLIDLPVSTETIKYLSEKELNRLTGSFQAWFDQARGKTRRIMGRYWLVFLMARYTGARISEVLMIDDTVDIDFRGSRIQLWTLKRKKPFKRTVAVPPIVTTEVATYLAEWPNMRGMAFGLARQNFFTKLKTIGSQTGISKDKLHPHVLRHSRAMEMVSANVPLNVIQQVLGHSSILNTAVYLQISGRDAEQIMRDRGLI
ncbi:MAG: site-specific integrase [Thermodesulfobacteriota bacterium]|nr:site-specific integrase [Thermodesulfobacteriota bacterium]